MNTMPLFVFDRRRDIEQEANFLLAGTIVVDIPKKKAHKPRNQQKVGYIMQTLVDMARAGTLPNGMFAGWPEGMKPANSKAIIDDDALMKAWSKDRFCAAVRVEQGEDTGTLRLDSDVLRQMGLGPDGSRLN
jgi:hypothetical protein